MVRLMLVRHGQTAWNAAGRYQGQTDVPLSDVGRRQAQALGRRLAAEEIHAVYASDLRRAGETAEIIARSRADVGRPPWPMHAEPRLREMAFGAWEGLTYEEITARDPQGLAAWQADSLHVAPPGGETLTQLAARVRSLLDDVVAAHSGQASAPSRCVLLVAHGGLLRVLLCLALGLAADFHWRFHLDVASLSALLLYDTDAVLVGLNDTHHLEGLSQESVGWDG